MIAYDFPQRLRTAGAAARELRKLTRALDTATDHHGDQAATYLRARRARARTAARHLGHHDADPSEITE